MSVRVGIELSPAACRIVALDAAARRDATRVTFATIARPGGAALPGALASLRGQRAAVVIWTAAADHRQVVVASGSYEEMLAEAGAACRPAARAPEPRLSDIAPIAAPSGSDRPKRTVLLASAAAAEVASKLRPLLDAGVTVDRVLTPAAALLSLARARRTGSQDSVLEAYVAVDETCGCMTLVRGGVLLASMDLPWGFMQDGDGHPVQRARDEVALKLADDLFQFVMDCRVEPEHLKHICICGGVPDMRSMTMVLMEQFDIEVEPLDSLFAIDDSRLPGNPDEFRERAPALRLAWAAAADPHPPIDLLRMRRRRVWGARLSRAVVVAGTAFGVAVGWEVQEAWGPASAAAPAALATAAPPQARAGSASSGALASAPDEPSSRRPAPRPSESGLDAGPSASDPGSLPAARDGSPPASAENDVAPPPPPPRPFRPRQEPVGPPRAAPEPSDPKAASLPTVPRAPARAGPGGTSPGMPSAVQPPRPPLPFEAALETILYGPDRRLALVDGRIVETGDVLRGATIVEITPTAVMLRDTRGQLRRLTAASGAR